MQGTGTQEDPLQITNVEELRWLLEKGGKNQSYGLLMNDIDLSSIDSTIDCVTSWSCEPRKISGNGRKIRNFNKNFALFNMSDRATYNVPIIFNDVIFENIIFDGEHGCFVSVVINDTGNDTLMTFNDCIFSINVYSNNQFTKVPNDGTETRYFAFNNCTIAVNSSSQNHNTELFWKCNFNNSHIHIEGNIHQITKKAIMKTSYITGSTTNNTAILMNESIEFSNSYIAVTANGASAKIFDYIIPAVNATSFVDKDIVTSTGISDSSIKQLTTAQAKNAEYLTSIGFLTIPESE